VSRNRLGYPGTLRPAWYISFAATLLASACGRRGFDELTSDAAVADPDAGLDACTSCGGAFQPSVGNCRTASAGPFVRVATHPTAGGGYGVWSAPPNILVADTTGGLRNLWFDGTAFASVGSLSGLGWVEAVWSDGTYFYVGAPGTGLAVVDVSGDGALTLRTQETTKLVEARRGWTANGLQYVPSGPNGLFAFRYDGSALTQVGVPTATLNWAQGAWATGSRVLFADGGVFRVLDFDGTAFTDVITPDARHGGSRVWSDGDKIFVASTAGATAYRLQGTTLLELDTFPTAGNARDIWSDGVHVFVAAEGGGLYALAFTNDTFSLVDQIHTGGLSLGVFGDGTYIYGNDSTGGLQAFSGFRCTSW
jgi:hypothetical protein